jgi:hypothetical protein
MFEYFELLFEIIWNKEDNEEVEGVVTYFNKWKKIIIMRLRLSHHGWKTS